MSKTEEFEVPITMGDRINEYLEKADAEGGFKLPEFPVKADGKWDCEKLKKLDEQAGKEFWAPPYDARFPQCNKSRMCFIWYQDYHRCINLLGEDYAPCRYFKNYYKSICPQKWQEKYDDWVDRGIFPARFDR